jgi:hypothetical protein
VLRLGGGAGAFGLALGSGRAAGFGTAFGLTAGLGGAAFFGTALAGLGADFLTAGLALERAAGAEALAFFTGEGRLALRRSFAMLVLLSRSNPGAHLGR